jgi:hypothetical protein
MKLRAADGSVWKVNRYALRAVPTLRGRTWRAARATPDGRQPGTIFDQGVRGQALGCLLPLEIASLVVGRGAALAIAPIDLALCATGRKPWPVKAQRTGRTSRCHTWPTSGWHASSARVEEVAHALRTGRHLPGGEAPTS